MKPKWPWPPYPKVSDPPRRWISQVWIKNMERGSIRMKMIFLDMSQIEEFPHQNRYVHKNVAKCSLFISLNNLCTQAASHHFKKRPGSTPRGFVVGVDPTDWHEHRGLELLGLELSFQIGHGSVTWFCGLWLAQNWSGLANFDHKIIRNL